MALALVRGQVTRLRPPRALLVDFPLGRPLGRPGDPALQRRVLDAAFELLKRPSGPVLEEFGEHLDDAADQPLACPVPPRVDLGLPAAVDEARGLRSAYERTVAVHGGTTTLAAVEAADIPNAIAALVRVAEGTPWKEAGLPANPIQTVLAVRAYYEEAALALVEHVPEARSSESWFFQQTETGRIVMRARRQMRDSGAPQPLWYYMAPATQPFE